MNLTSDKPGPGPEIGYFTVRLELPAELEGEAGSADECQPKLEDESQPKVSRNILINFWVENLS